MGTSIEGGWTLNVPCYPHELILGGQAEPKQSVFEQSATQQYELGTLLWYPHDGRKFRYAYNGGVALSKALMTQSSAGVANVQEEVQTTSGASAVAGDQEITVDVTNASGITDDLYAGGWLVVNKATSMGDIYKVLACKLLTTATARILLETPLRNSLSATSEITLVANKWKGVLVCPTTPSQVPTGVPLINVTINYYCWLQTGGPTPILVDTSDTIVVGNNVGSAGTAAVAGACGVQTAGTFPIWGTVMYVATGDECALIDLKLD